MGKYVQLIPPSRPLFFVMQQGVTMYDIDMDTAGGNPAIMKKIRASNPKTQIICYISVGTWEPEAGRVVSRLIVLAASCIPSSSKLSACSL